MMTLQATPRAKAVHRKVKKKGGIPDPPSETVEHGWTGDVDEIRSAVEQDMTEVFDRVRMRRASLAVAGSPLVHRRQEKVFPTEPTPEMRKRYAGRFEAEVVVPGAGPVQPLNRHRPKRILETYEKHFNEHERNVLARFSEDAEAATIHHVTLNYGGASGGGRPWERLGGLGNVSQRKIDQYMRFQFVWDGLPHQFHDAARWLVFEVGSAGMDTLPGMVEAAQRWVPTLKHKEVCRGISIGVLKALAWNLMRLYLIERDQRMYKDKIKGGAA